MKALQANHSYLLESLDFFIFKIDKRDNWPLILSDQAFTVSSVFKLRSASLNDGSPIMPVPPPTKAMGT